MFRYAIAYIDGQGRKLVESISKFIKPLIESPRELLLNMMQLQSLAKNVGTAAGITAAIVGLIHLREVLVGFSHLPIVNKISGPLLSLFDALLKVPILGTALNSFINIFKTGPVTGIGSLLSAIGMTMLKMAGVFAVFLIPLLGLQRAMDRIKLDSMEWFANNMSSLVDAFSSLRNSLSIFMAPIMDMIDGFSNLFYAIMGGTASLDAMKATLETVASIIGSISSLFLDFYAAFRGMIAGFVGMWSQAILNIGTMVSNLLSGNFRNITAGTDNIFEEFMKNGAEEFMKTVDKYRTPTLTPEGVENAKVVNPNNYYDVTMNNSFKEVLQPDRIAFTIQNQLEKASANRKSSGGASFGEQQARSI
jgi:hypothetical protein